ncbi:MAG: TetR/AcrR family transcriptional regulator [Nocardioidaceae bacterium]
MSSSPKPPVRSRMTGAARREQLLDVAREVFAERGFGATAIEEIAARADVSKPVVYEHFGGKDGIYASVVEREVTELVTSLQVALTASSSRQLLEQAVTAILDYVEHHPHGFRILVRDSPLGSSIDAQQSIVGDIATRLEVPLQRALESEGIDASPAPLYAQMVAGSVAQTGRWWLDAGGPDRRTVATQLVNLLWNGLANLEGDPLLATELPPSPRTPDA